MIQAVIFDWAGTTVDYGCFAPVQAFQQAFAHFQVPVTLEETRKPMGLLKRDHIRTMLQNPDNKWVQYVNRGLDELDPQVIKMTALNLGFQAAFVGTKQIRMNREKYNCNIPWTMLMDPTSACNLHCTGCWAAEYGHKLNLSYEKLSDIISQGKELGTYFYMFTGGEPLVRKKDILRLAEEHHDCEFHCFTNGTLIDEEFCEAVQKLGNISFSLSLEGFEEVNDGRRGEGIFDKKGSSMKRDYPHLCACST